MQPGQPSIAAIVSSCPAEALALVAGCSGASSCLRSGDVVVSFAPKTTGKRLTSTPPTWLEKLRTLILTVAERSRRSDGPVCLVLGAGMIGTLIVQALRVAAASHIFAADLDANRLAAVGRSGAHTLINLDHAGEGQDAASTVLQKYAGGVDHVFEAVGFGSTVKTAVAAVRKGGTVTLVGNIAPQVELPLQAVVTRQIRLQGSAASAGEYPRAIELLASKQIDVSPLISAVEPLSRGADAFERLYRREPNLIKIVLTPDPLVDARMNSEELVPPTPPAASSAANSKLFDLTGRVALVTGTSRGLGQYFARSARTCWSRPDPDQP